MELAMFVAGHVEATRECVSVMEKIRTSSRSKHPEVMAAREKVVDAHRSFDYEWTMENREILKEAKQLFNTYDKIKGEELMERVRRVEAARGEQRVDFTVANSVAVKGPSSISRFVRTAGISSSAPSTVGWVPRRSRKWVNQEVTLSSGLQPASCPSLDLLRPLISRL
ncbi:hypothetical protein AAFF_G00439190 [Aldrovandia affinis]|uniref:Uncharacterized protein n=1 Tax=Aldrovandia affinis TaxID=143900 RepID=A0AAD7S7G2_9TELE|nr:hypothetical protein AAFF_G00439190 [Aldrovandia affinis]